MKFRHTYQRQLELSVILLGLLAFWSAFALIALSIMEAGQ